MVTVLLPTASRPGFLTIALQSIATQTALGKITRIFVSENGGDRTSERICAEYPHLPITYIFREPAVTPLQHAQLLMKECLEGDVIFFLHDDDWWLPQHVEKALAALEAEPEAAAFGSNYALFQGKEISDELNELAAWFGMGFPPVEGVWKMNPSHVLLASIFGPVVHYTCLAVRTEALRAAAYVFDLGNPFDNDRMLIYALALKGPLLFGVEFTVGIRVHGNRDSETFTQDERMRRLSETTAWMVGQSRKPWSLVAASYIQRIARCPAEVMRNSLIHQSTIRPWCLPELARHLDRNVDKEFFELYDPFRARFASEKLVLER